MNRELFKKIHDVIRVEPEGFDMHSWENDACGTTRCIAGWAIALTVAGPLKDPLGRPSVSVLTLADHLGVDADFEKVGGALLDLDPEDAAALFYTDNVRGAKFVRLAATEGEVAAWDYFHEEIA